jgi:hypothetical protein
MFGIEKLEARLRSVEKRLAGLCQHAERTQNEWRQTREEIVIQMEEIRRILRPNEPKE